MTQRPSQREVFPPEVARYIDVAAYVLDARAPSASLWLDDKLLGRECFIFARRDLADSKTTEKWLKYFEESGYPVFAVNAPKGEGVEKFLDFLGRVYEAKDGERRARGIKKSVLRIVVLGVPNVGKSTFLNAILGKKKVRVGDRPGITRGYQWIRVMKDVHLLDTPGIIRETAHFKRHRATWLALNLLAMDEGLLEPAVGVVLLALPRRARAKFEKYYKFEMPWGGEPEEFAVKISMIKRLFVGQGIPDVTRAYRVILRDFQRGRFGRLSIETPDENPVVSPFFKDPAHPSDEVKQLQ